MISPLLLLATISLPSANDAIVFDSASRRRPQIHVSSLAKDWSPAILAGAESSNQRLPRKRLQDASSPFVGNWAGDFAAFKRMWPKAVADGSWQFLVTGFWRAVQGLTTDFGDPPPRDQWPRILDEWDAWIESVDPRIRASLGEMTGNEFCKQAKPLGAQTVAPGERYSLDFSSTRIEGVVTARVQRYLRKGLTFDRLVPAKAPAPWASESDRFWSTSFGEPGLYRVVLRAPGWYQQTLVQVTNTGSLSISTDSGALVWAPGGKGRKWLLWKSAKGKIDSTPIGEAPLHFGFPPEADSGLVGIASGNDLSVLRLRRPRTRQANIVYGSKSVDWYGHPVMSLPRPDIMGFSWASAIVATPDAIEPGALARLSGVVRRMGPHGRPDSARADSVELRIDTGKGPSMHRSVPVSASGIWTDSVMLRSGATFYLGKLWSGGRVVVDEICQSTRIRVRDASGSRLAGRYIPMDGARRPQGEVHHRLQPDSARLLVLASGKALDWKFPVTPKDTGVIVPVQPLASGGWSLDRLDADGPHWSHNRAEILFEPPAGEGWMGLTVDSISDTVASKSAFTLRLEARYGAAVPAEVMVALTLDSLAGDLAGMTNFLGKAWARSEISVPGQTRNASGINNMGSPIEDFDEETEPDRFTRLGILSTSIPCVRCRPWTGSYSENPFANYRNQESCSIGYSFGPESSAPEKLPSPEVWKGPVSVGLDGKVSGGFEWPSAPGLYRLQLWGVDASGRMLAWEQSVTVR